MAIAVIGGLVSSTLLTLLLVPVVYSVLDGFLQRIFGRAIAGETAPNAQAPAGTRAGRRSGRSANPLQEVSWSRGG